MEYVVTAKEMKAYDSYTIDNLGIPALVLMERAALHVAEAVAEYTPPVQQSGRRTKVLVAAGSGNNGGDGLAAARLLTDRGYCVDTVLIGGGLGRLSDQTKQQLQILKNYGMSVGSNIREEEYDIIVDAVFGIGQNRETAGEFKSALQKINEMKAYKIAVDIPSGVDADTGRIWGTAARADLTVTFGFLKRGLLLYPGAAYAGKVSCVDIGITQRALKAFDIQNSSRMYTLTEPVSRLLLSRDPSGNKGTFGKVLLVAGSKNMAGAALLSGESAFRAGAGMVRTVTCEENRVIVQERLPEAMLLTYPSEDFWEEMEKAAGWADCILIGPGISKGKWAKLLFRYVLEKTRKPLVVDADALNLLAEEADYRNILKKSIQETGRQVLLTPHVGELARLNGSAAEEVKQDFWQAVRSAAEAYGCTVAGKDARTMVYEAGKPVFINTAGNSGMATAGSGDVLAGIAAAFCAGGLGAYDSAVMGVYLHACAGDEAAARMGEAGMTASDIISHMTMLQAGKDRMQNAGKRNQTGRI